MAINNILVPTDFSPCAADAVETAAELARLNDSKLHFFHAVMKLHFEPDMDMLKKEAKEKLEAKQVELQGKGIESDYTIVVGELAETLEDHLSENDVDLVVMGSHGASGPKEWFMGSNAQKTIRKIHNNVLVIKETFKPSEVKSAVYVTGLMSNDKESFKSYLSFLRRTDVQDLHIMTVDTSGFFAQPTSVMMETMKEFEEIAKDFSPKVHFYKDLTIEAGVKHFSNDYQIDLVGIGHRDRRPLKRIFLGSTVEMLVNHLKSPVLVVN